METKKNILKNRLRELKVFGLERAFKFWLIISWITLLTGYSLLIIASTLFGEAPLWLPLIGSLGIYFTSVNFFIALILACIYLIASYVRKEKEIIGDRVFVILAYILATGILYLSSTI